MNDNIIKEFNCFFSMGLEDKINDLRLPSFILNLFLNQTLSDYYTNIDNIFKIWVNGIGSKKYTESEDLSSFSLENIVGLNYFDKLMTIINNSFDDSFKNATPSYRAKANQQAAILLDMLKLSLQIVLDNLGLINFKASEAVLNAQKIEKLSQLNDSITENISGIEKKIKDCDDKIKDDEEKVNEIDEKINKLSQENAQSSITILGIFVGIVMVFFGGFTILENTITSMANSTPYRLYFTMLAFGGIMYNVVVILFFLISRMINKPITCVCYKNNMSTPSTNDCFDCKSRKILIGACRIKHTLPYIYWGDFIIATGLAFIAGLKFFANPENVLQLNLKQFLFASILPIIIIVFAYFLGRAKHHR